jgi:hypothetical protein
MAELQKALVYRQERCDMLRRSNLRLKSRLSEKVDEGWQRRYELEISKQQELMRRLCELEKESKANCDILFEDFWAGEAADPGRKSSYSSNHMACND